MVFGLLQRKKREPLSLEELNPRQKKGCVELERGRFAVASNIKGNYNLYKEVLNKFEQLKANGEADGLILIGGLPHALKNDRSIEILEDLIAKQDELIFPIAGDHELFHIYHIDASVNDNEYVENLAKKMGDKRPEFIEYLSRLPLAAKVGSHTLLNGMGVTTEKQYRPYNDFREHEIILGEVFEQIVEKYIGKNETYQNREVMKYIHELREELDNINQEYVNSKPTNLDDAERLKENAKRSWEDAKNRHRQLFIDRSKTTFDPEIGDELRDTRMIQHLVNTYFNNILKKIDPNSEEYNDMIKQTLYNFHNEVEDIKPRTLVSGHYNEGFPSMTPYHNRQLVLNTANYDDPRMIIVDAEKHRDPSSLIKRSIPLK